MDASHEFGSDLVLAANGDLLLVSGDDESRQRILRRLLTCAQDYLWQPDYGAGIPRRIGDTLNQPELTSLITGQMRLEQGVSQDTPPAVTLTPIPGGVACSIQYIGQNGDPQYLSFEVTP